VDENRPICLGIGCVCAKINPAPGPRRANACGLFDSAFVCAFATRKLSPNDPLRVVPRSFLMDPSGLLTVCHLKSAIKLRTNWLLGEWHIIVSFSSHSARNKPPPDHRAGFCLIEYMLRQRNAVLLSLPTLTL
jgi:hypothetical protein